jgi:hypothetical protein
MVLKGTPCDLSILNGRLENMKSLMQKQDGDGIMQALKEITA